MQKILYVTADLRRVGPTNQTLNIILNANDSLENVKVLTLFKEAENSMKAEYESKGIVVETLNLPRGNFLTICLGLYKYLKKERVKVIHSYGTKPDICLFVVSKFLKFTHILTARNIPMEDYPPRMRFPVGIITAKIHTFVIRHTKYAIACSKTVAKFLKENYGCKRISAIQNGVDTSKFFNLNKTEIRNKLGLPTDAKILISTGFFIPRKHNDLILKAFSNLNLENAIILMLGDGVLLKELQNKYKGNNRIIFKGLVPNVSDYLSAADLFVSASDSEGLPNAVLEALACNCPVVLSDILQHKEILKDLPDCGELFELNNLQDMQNKITERFEISNLEISKKLADSPFTMKEMGRKYKDFYSQVKSL